MEKLLTLLEYAKLRDKSPQGMTKAIRKKHKMPGVQKVQRFGKMYLLTVTFKKDGSLKY